MNVRSPAPAMMEKKHRNGRDTQPRGQSRSGMHTYIEHVALEDDPLDSLGKGPNWLTGLPYSERYHELVPKWKELPMYKDKQKLRLLADSFRDTQVTIVQSGTGSGKTVIAPKLVLKGLLQSEHMLNQMGSQPRHPVRVAVSNPKSNISRWNAEWAALTLDAQLGHEVGFSFREAPPDSSSKDTRLLFATDGYLVSSHREDPLFSKYSAIIVDEVHERTVQIDTLLFMLRRALAVRQELRAVIISATIDPRKYEDYFHAAQVSTKTVEVSGAPNHPVTSVFSSVPGTESNYMDLGIRMLAKAMKHTFAGEDILFFVPTSKDAEKGCKEVHAACRGGGQQQKQQEQLPPSCTTMKCSPLYSKLPLEKQKEATDTTVQLPFDRRIIVSTNIAESSLTLPSLTVVLESGLELENRWVPEFHGYRMDKVRITRAQIRQRMGRVGRTRPGICYHLYTKDQMDAVPMEPDPNILAVDITDDILTMMRSRTYEAACTEFADFLTPPTGKQVACAASVLSFYGFLKFDQAATFRDVDFSKIQQDMEQRITYAAPTKSPPPTFSNDKSPVDNDHKLPKRISRRRGGSEPSVPASLHSSNVPVMKKNVDTFKYAYTGKITPLGLLALDVMRACRMGLWNTLLVMAGMAYSDAFHSMVTLACIMEECNSDIGAIWRDETRSHIVMSKVKLHPSLEHASVLSVFEEATAPRKREAYAEQGLINYALVERIEERIRGTKAKLSRFAAPWAKDKLRESPLFSLDKYAEQPLPYSELEKSIICARLYHHATKHAPSPPNPATPLPAVGERQSLKKKGGSDNDNKSKSFVSTITLDKLQALPDGKLLRGKHLPEKLQSCVYETASLSKAGTRLKTVSFLDIMPLVMLRDKGT